MIRPSPEQYEAIRRCAGVLDRSARGRIIVRGGDRASYLQGMLTNDILGLRPGTGGYAAYLTPQGRMITDMEVINLGDRFLLSVPGSMKDPLLTRFDEFIFAEDVQLEDVTASTAQLSVHGPGAAATLTDVLRGNAELAGHLSGFREYEHEERPFNGSPVLIVHTRELGERGFDLFVDAAQSPPLQAALVRAGAVPVNGDTATVLRVEYGRPAFPVDMDQDTIPLEAGIEDRALSMTKGCYVGQEVIVRVLHRGHGRVARRLVGLRVEPAGEGDQVPVAGGRLYRELEADGDVGRITSIVWSPALEQPIALGYVHRDLVTPGTIVWAAVPAGRVPALVSPLPFVQPAA